MKSEISLAPEIMSSVERALAEDIGSGDATTDSIIPVEAEIEAAIVAKESGVAAGLSIAEAAFQLLDKRVHFKSRIRDGESVQAAQLLAELSGPARAILSGERRALNFLGR